MEGSLLIDVAQNRVVTDRVTAVVGGKDWSDYYYVDTYIHRSTGSVILLPAPLDPAYTTTTTGRFTRLKKADFALTSASWKERDWSDVAGDTVLDLVGTNEVVITTATLAFNTGVYLEWFVYGSGRDNYTQMVTGWSNDGTNATGPSVKIDPRGSIEVYYNGQLDGRYTLSRPKRSAEDERADGDNGRRIDGKPFGIVLIPGFRRNCLLGVTTDGGTFLHEFTQFPAENPVLPGDDTTHVAKTSKWWWNVPEGAAMVQSAIVKYPESGYACSRKAWLADVPTDEQFAAYRSVVFFDNNGAGVTPYLLRMVTQGDVETDYDPHIDGIAARVRVNLTTSDPVRSPTVYGGSMEYNRLVASTVGPECELLGPDALPEDDPPEDPQGKTVHLSFNVAEAPNSTTLTADVRNPEAFAGLGGPGSGVKLGTMQYRPVSLDLGGTLAFFGVGEQPEFTDSWNQEARYVSLPFKDLWKVLEMYVYRDPKVFDGYLFSSTGTGEPNLLFDILTDAGIPSASINLYDDPFRVPSTPPADGRFNATIEPGATAAKALQEFMDAYAGNWLYTFRPRAGQWEFAAGPESHFGVTEAATIYWTRAEAITDGVDPSQVTKHTYRKWKQRPLPIEANAVYIEGVDLASGLPILIHKKDVGSQNPVLPPEDRPDNWVGSVLPYGLYLPQITNLDLGQDCCEKIFERITKAYFGAEWESDLIFDPIGGHPLWRYDVVRLSGHGLYRISSISVTIKRIERGGNVWYKFPARYTGVKIGD